MKLNLIYLAAPISLVFLNPIGFFLLSYATNGGASSQSLCRTIGDVSKGVASNPLVFMSFLGIIVNFATNHSLPSIADDLLVTVGNAYASTSLFLLGYSMVGKMSNMKVEHMFLPLVLTLVKVKRNSDAETDSAIQCVVFRCWFSPYSHTKRLAFWADRVN